MTSPNMTADEMHNWALQNLSRAMNRTPDAEPFGLYFDKYTGKNVLIPNGDHALFEKPEGHVGKVLDVPYDALASTISDLADRRKLPSVIAGFGGKPPARLTEALDVHDAIAKTVLTPDMPNVMTMKASDATKAVIEYADQLSRLAASRDAINVLKDDAYRRIVCVSQESVTDVLKDRAVRAEFDSAAKEFSEAYPLVREIQSIGEAALADDTGETLGAWHRATKAAVRLDAVVDLIAGLAAPAEPLPSRVTTPRKRTGTRFVLGISADPIDSVELFTALQAHGIDGPTAPKRYPWSMYGAQIDSGASLSLPADRDDLDDRTDAYSESQAREIVNGQGSVVFNGIGHVGPEV